MKKGINNNDIKYFDAHSHLHSSFFNKKEDGKKTALKMKEKNIYSTIIGVNFLDSKKAFEMALKNDNLFCSIGIHPADENKENWDQKDFESLLEKDLKNIEKGKEKKIVSVGECGLDYYWVALDYKEKIKEEIRSKYEEELKFGRISKKEVKKEIENKFQKDFEKGTKKEKERQKELFESQIDFAQKYNLPLMLHIRSCKNADAHYDVFDILDKKQKEFDQKDIGKIKADFHFFTESPEIVREVIKRGYMISLPGVITFADLDKTVLEIPLENIMTETDSPFAAPVPFRGKTNTPLYVSEVVKKIALVKKISEEEVRKISVDNALRFFDIE